MGFGISAEAAIVSHPELTSLTDSTMIITWSTTDEASTTEIQYGIGNLSSSASLSGTTKYHYQEISGLYPNTTYQYRIKSGSTLYPPASMSPLTFKTLAKPSGDYLFSFAVINRLRYTDNLKSDTMGARGVPFTKGTPIITAEVADINNHNVAFTVINGNIADASQDTPATYTNQISSKLKGMFENLQGAANLPSSVAYKYLALPGYHDKAATYSAGDWIASNLGPLTTDPASTESRYGYTSPADVNKDSVFNYQFKYNYYNFIFLDSVKADSGGLVSLEALNNHLSAESNSKTFVFLSYPPYDIDNINGEKDYPTSLPTDEAGAVKITNDEAFRATVEAYKDQYGNPIVGAVVYGHLSDNYKREINDIAYVRQGPAVGFPTGYSIYKVYTNGFVKTFYKCSARDGTDKPYYEYARDQISAEAGFPADVLSSFWLGSNSLRNFTVSYPFIPGVSPAVSSVAPASNESTVALNRPILIRFNKRMSDQNLSNWVTVSPSVGTLTAGFVDSNRTILKISHATDFTVNQSYAVTVKASEVKDEGLTAMGSDYVFSFDTIGGSKDTNPPTASINALPNNTTTNPFPSFSGIASDESGVANVEYRIDSGSWITAEAIDGTFSSTSEVFIIILASPLSNGSHVIWLRTTDGAGNTSTTGFSAYSFSVAEDKPTISITIDSSRPIPGDPISSTPKIEITVVSANALQSGRITVDTTQTALTFVQTATNYLATHEVLTALADGVHGLTVEAFDVLGKAATYEVTSLYVQSAGDVTIQGIPLNYPNPFDPGSQTTTISYTLSKPANITLSFHDLAGNLIAKRSYTANLAGGRAGYNEVTWDGKSDSGNYVGNGIYLYLIIVDGKVAQNGKGKLTVFKR
ncbi:MAG: Ig-like domain-containing protein [Candidatus Margulisiibacteriota bacterium]